MEGKGDGTLMTLIDTDVSVKYLKLRRSVIMHNRMQGVAVAYG